MADFRVDTSFFTHAKTKKLRKILGLGGVFALLQLWAYAAANKHDAEKVYSAEDIELAVDWDGEPGSLVSVLATVGFVDEVPAGFVIHEWGTHNGYAATAAKRSAAGRNAAAARWNSKRLCGGNADACEPQSDGNTAAMPSHANSNADACEPQSDGNTAAMPSHANSNAPFPFPFPSPSPLPLPSPGPGSADDDSKASFAISEEIQALAAKWEQKWGEKLPAVALSDPDIINKFKRMEWAEKQGWFGLKTTAAAYLLNCVKDFKEMEGAGTPSEEKVLQLLGVIA